MRPSTQHGAFSSMFCLYNFNRLLNDLWLWYWPLLLTAPHELNIVLRSFYFARKKNETPIRLEWSFSILLPAILSACSVCILAIETVFYFIKYQISCPLQPFTKPFLPPTFLEQLLCPTHPLVPRVGVPAPLCIFYSCFSSLCPCHTFFFLGFVFCVPWFIVYHFIASLSFD